jgi:hypothetical protein
VRQIRIRLKQTSGKIVQKFIQHYHDTNMPIRRYISVIIALLMVGSLASSPHLLIYADDIIGGGPDSDSDGLSDSFEEKLGSDPTLLDSDNDGLEDGLEFTGGDSGIRTDPTASDTDKDGVSDSLELAEGIDPTDIDSDNDGLVDGFERSTGTDPVERDSDSDGLSDSFENSQNTNPLLGDTDKDGVTDSVEVRHGTDPLDADTFFVLPESPVGPVAMMVASMSALGGFLYFRSRKLPLDR